MALAETIILAISTTRMTHRPVAAPQETVIAFGPTQALGGFTPQTPATSAPPT